MTIESVMSDTKYAYRAIRDWFLDRTGLPWPLIQLHEVVPAPCEHRVLIGHLCDPVQETPCADCGALVNITSFAFKYGCFYIVAADK